MYSVVAYSKQEAAHNALREVCAEQPLISVSGGLTEVVETLRECGPAVALVVTLSEPSEFVLPTIRVVRDQFPWLPIIGAFRWPNDIHHVIDAVRAGLDDLVPIPGGDLADTVARAAASRLDSKTARDATELARRYVSDLAKPLVDTAIRLARSAPTVSEFASALGVSKRTLSRRLSRAQLPQASELLAWARCLVASILLENESAKVESIARELRFPSSAALRKTLRRLTGLRPRQIRWRGGPELVAKSIHALPARESPSRNQKAS